MMLIGDMFQDGNTISLVVRLTSDAVAQIHITT